MKATFVRTDHGAEFATETDHLEQCDVHTAISTMCQALSLALPAAPAWMMSSVRGVTPPTRQIPTTACSEDPS